MAEEIDPPESQEPEGEAQAAPVAPPAAMPPAPVGPPKLMTAAEFVQKDLDRPKADESVQEGGDAGAVPQTSGSPGTGKAGRPRSSNTAAALRMRKRYAERIANRAPPPDFSDMPGGKPAPVAGQPAQAGQPAPAYSPGAAPMSHEMYMRSAEALVVTVTGFLAMALSKAWKVDEDDKDQLVRDIGNMMEYNHWSSFSPNIAAMLTIGMYILSRSDDPETRRKLGKLFKRIRGDKGSKTASASDAMNEVRKPDDLEAVIID
jgi:hypothetical protein